MSRTLAFGDLDAGIWGVAWVPGGDEPAAAGAPAALAAGAAGSPAALAAGAGPEEATLTAALTGTTADEEWSLAGPGVDLLLAPASAPAGADGFDQLCHVTGRLTVGGTEHELDLAGWRAMHTGSLEPERIGSFRQVAAWFGSDEGLALLALRPRGAEGQESDVVRGAVLEPEHGPHVVDPRLSTTYRENGVPVRAGLELWLEQEEPEDPEADEAAEQFPRRAAGESAGRGLDFEASGFALHAAPLRWHSRGQDGTGVYLLGRRTS